MWTYKFYLRTGWSLDTRYWILDAGCWMLDAGYWLLAAGYCTGCWLSKAAGKDKW
jgi:hypothetical protein